MIVCVCKAVSDRQIRAAANSGRCSSVRDLARELGVGTCCGKCLPEAQQTLAKTLAAAEESIPSRVFAAA